ncbi:MAG: hypothetical protein ACJ73C_13375 [Nitrososphaeraceae archaeon]|jgi:CO dehydrogenase/acetyl-CoA synthase beta subunit
MKLELLTNATVVDDAIRFVSQKSKEKLKTSANDSEHDKEESNERDYDEYEDQLEEQEDEEEAGEMALTTNAVFKGLDARQRLFYLVELVEEEEE